MRPGPRHSGEPGYEWVELESAVEVEALARALEEAAARVRMDPPSAVRAWVYEDDVEPIEAGPDVREQIHRTVPRIRHFHLDWDPSVTGRGCTSG